MTADCVGGVWTYALDLARALGGHGVQVDLATMGRLPSATQTAEAAAIPNLTLYPSAFALEWEPDPWDDMARAGDWLLGLEAELKPDVVHLNGYVHGALPWAAPTLMVGHSCVLSWWRAVRGADAPPEWDRYAEAVRPGLHAARAVVAPTQAMLDALTAHYGPFPASALMRVVPNGRDASLFTPATKQPFVFCAGRLWDDAKNVRALDAAADGLPWPVRVAGDTAHGAGQEARAENAWLLGRLSPAETAAQMAAASVYALPARYEPFGLSALEAGLSGCALVLGDIPSLREVWGDAALFVPPDDPAALRAALCHLIADDALRGKLSARAEARAQTYTLARMADGYLAAYADIA